MHKYLVTISQVQENFASNHMILRSLFITANNKEEAYSKANDLYKYSYVVYIERLDEE